MLAASKKALKAALIIANNSIYGAFGTTLLKQQDMVTENDNNPYLEREFSWTEYVSEKAGGGGYDARDYDGISFGIPVGRVSEGLHEEIRGYIGAVAQGYDRPFTVDDAAAVVVRVLEERAAIALDKDGGPFAVTVTEDFDEDGTHLLHVTPQNMATLLAVCGVFLRSLNGLETDYLIMVDAELRLFRNSAGGSVYAVSVEPIADWAVGKEYGGA